MPGGFVPAGAPRRAAWAGPATALALAVLCALSLSLGAASLSDEGWRLLWLSRLPRTLAALLAGAALAVSGVVMQALVRNRFVEPGTTGANEAAMLGLLAVTLLSPGAPLLAKMAAAAGAALLGTGGFLLLVRRLDPRDPFATPLVGLVWGGVLGALATFVAWQADLLQALGAWMTGELSGVLLGRYELLWIAGAAAGIAWLAADRITIVGLGRDRAEGLGLNPGQVVAVGLVAVSLVTASVVATLGAVPFLGLVVPNLVARICGDNLRRSLPVVAAAGAGLLLLADILGRVIRAPYEIPAGTVAGVVGAGAVLWLVLRGPTRAG